MYYDFAGTVTLLTCMYAVTCQTNACIITCILQQLSLYYDLVSSLIVRKSRMYCHKIS